MMRLLVPMVLTALITGCAGSRRTSDDDPKNAEDHVRRAVECYGKAQFDQAIKELDEAIRLDTRNAGAFRTRGAAWFAKKEYGRAITDLDESIRLDSVNASSAYCIRGAAWYMKKEYAKGVKDLDRAIELNANEVEALNSRAWAAATCPDPKFRDRTKALDFARRACELDGSKNAFFLGTLAAAYAENGDFENALKWQRKALEDQSYQKECGADGLRMLKLFEQKQPYREEAGGDK